MLLYHAFRQKGTDKEEVFDDQFAAALLIPGYAVHKLIRHGWDVPQMADFFGVSNSAMSIRLNNLRIGTAL